MSERITEADLRRLDSLLDFLNDAAADFECESSGQVASLRKLLADWRRLRGLIEAWYFEPGDTLIALGNEARAIRAEKQSGP